MIQSIHDMAASTSNQLKVSATDPITFSAIKARTKFANTGNRSIAYRSIGNGEPMILCNRFRGNMDDWDPAFLDALAVNYNVITFDYSGFGLSTGEPQGSMLHFAKDVKDLAEVLQLQKIILCGWSIGGCVAQVVTTEFPELVFQTILIGTRPPGKVDHSMEEIFLKTAYKPFNDLEDEIILFFEPTSSFSRQSAKLSHERIAQRTEDKDIRIHEELWPYYGKALEEFTNDPYQALQKLTQTSIPILVISADHEVCFPPENWFALNRKLLTTQIVVIPQAGHGPHHQYPELVANYITAFIQQHYNI